MPFRESRSNFSSTFKNDDHNTLVEEQRAIVASDQPAARRPRGSNKFRGSGRSNYNERRIVAQRTLKSQMTQDDLSAELSRKLFAGTKIQSAEERLEMYATRKAITLTVTTRGIGIGVCGIFESLYTFNNVPVRGSIYQMYRVALGVFEAKITIALRSTSTMQLTPDVYQEPIRSAEMVQAIQTVTVMPDQISSVVNDLGVVKYGDRQYIPRIALNRRSRTGRFIPDPVNVCLSNLRETVLALADHNTPLEHRQAFYRHNSIPGTVWRGGINNPILTNAEEICPDDYGPAAFLTDYDDIIAKMNFYNRKAPKYFTKPITFDPQGSKAMLVCNSLGYLRVKDRTEDLDDYYRSVRVEGDIDSFHNLERLIAAEQISGSLSLLGEFPSTPSLAYPAYIQRDIRMAVETSCLSFRSARKLKYS